MRDNFVRQFEKQTYSDPYLSEDSNPGSGNVIQGSSGHSPHDNEMCEGDNISSSGNILKMGQGSMRKARNHKSQTQGWGYISPSDKFQQEPILDLGFIQSNSLIQEGCAGRGGGRRRGGVRRDSVDIPSFPWLGSLESKVGGCSGDKQERSIL